MLLPLLAPLLAVLLLAALNPRPVVSIRLLTSRSPALPLGIWLAGGGAGAALLSGLGTALALRQGTRNNTGRRVVMPGAAQGNQSDGSWSAFRRRNAGSSSDAPTPSTTGNSHAEVWPQAGPARAPGEPPPTVSVPFRVLRRPPRSETMPEQRDGTTVAAGMGRSTGSSPDPDDWDSPDQDDW